jgi:hypothetical protein
LKKFKPLPTQKRLRELLDYNPETGVFIWKKRAGTSSEISRWNTRYSGKLTGNVTPQGYVVIRIYGEWYPASRLAWVYMHGAIKGNYCIDHINLNKSDNRICNLRLATRGQNLSNQAKRKSKTLSKGVTANESGFVSRIGLDGKVLYLGIYKTEKEAHAAYVEAARKYRREFARFE